VRWERFDVRRFEDFIAEWDRRDAWLGRSSQHRGWNEASLQGRARQGVNERGALKFA